MIYFLICAAIVVFSIISFRTIDRHCKQYYCDGQLIRDWDSNVMETIYNITFALKMISLVCGLCYVLSSLL